MDQRDRETEVGSYFVATYPPFSVWSADHVPAATAALDTLPPDNPPPLGLYVHIPFCRTRCKFCYYRVYTDKNSRDVGTYLEALMRETALYADRPALAGRTLEFVYFGGGTPSFLSSSQLERLTASIDKHWPWNDAREVTFECEPGTLQKSKLETIKALGTTRLSLGVEHFNDDILERSGRAHRSPEIFRAYEWAREVGFDQINIDLIAGMVGDKESTWRDTVEQALALDADSVTIYQMEIPHNTLLARSLEQNNGKAPVADWATKRAWVDEAFRRFEEAGYVVSSAYTVVKPSDVGRFVYRDALWHGADMLGVGVASFSHMAGMHFQNFDDWNQYIAALQDGKLPISRALPVTPHQSLIRELVLQLKLGRVDAGYFRSKFAVEITDAFSEPLDSLASDDMLTVQGDDLRLTRTGLLRVDSLLPAFFEPQFRNIRYT